MTLVKEYTAGLFHGWRVAGDRQLVEGHDG